MIRIGRGELHRLDIDDLKEMLYNLRPTDIVRDKNMELIFQEGDYFTPKTIEEKKIIHFLAGFLGLRDGFIEDGINKSFVFTHENTVFDDKIAVYYTSKTP